MITEDEFSDGGSVDQRLTTVERFQTRKFKGKGDACVGKRAVLKITGAGSSKKQRTPVKTRMKDTLSALVEGEALGIMTRTTVDTHRDLHEMDTTMEAKPSSADPINPSGSHDKSRQEQ
jgi:hypothetical protein